MVTSLNLLSGENLKLERRGMDNPHAFIAGAARTGKTTAVLKELSESLMAHPEDIAVVLCSASQAERYSAIRKAECFGDRVTVFRIEDEHGRSTEELVHNALEPLKDIVSRQFRSEKRGKTWVYIDSFEVLCRYPSELKNFYNILRVLKSRRGIFAGTIHAYEKVVKEKMMVHILNICGAAWLFRLPDSPGLISTIYGIPEIVTKKIKTLAPGNAIMFHSETYDFVSVRGKEEKDGKDMGR